MPYESPPEYASMCCGAGPGHTFSDLGDTQAAAQIDAYDGAVRYLDSELEKLFALLDERGVVVDIVEYLDRPPDRATLAGLIERAGGDPLDFVRGGQPTFEDAGFPYSASPSVDEILDLLTARPEAMQRPVFDDGNRVVIARPPERLFEVLDSEDG